MHRRTFLLAPTVLLYGADARRRPLPSTPIYLPGGKRLLPRVEYRGKVLLVFMIATYCEHCAEITQWLSRVQRDLGPRGFQALGVAFDEQAKIKIDDFIARYRPAFPFGVMDLQEGLKYAAISPSEPPTVPFFLFVDRNSVIRANFTGKDELFTKRDQSERLTRGIIGNLLKEGAAASPGPQAPPNKQAPAASKK